MLKHCAAILKQIAFVFSNTTN